MSRIVHADDRAVLGARASAPSRSYHQLRWLTFSRCQRVHNGVLNALKMLNVHIHSLLWYGARNGLMPTHAIWRHGSGSTSLVQVMACCLSAPSHYLNQCWLIINSRSLPCYDSRCASRNGGLITSWANQGWNWAGRYQKLINSGKALKDCTKIEIIFRKVLTENVLTLLDQTGRH